MIWCYVGCQIVDGRLENFNYAGIVTRVLQPILPVFFVVQFNFLYSGWRNEAGFKDLTNGLLLSLLGGGLLLVFAAVAADAGLLVAFGVETAAGLIESLAGGAGFDGLIETFQATLPQFDGML